MSNETHETTADAASNSDLIHTTRRRALRGAGLLAMGVGSASAQRVPSEGDTTRGGETETREADESVPVTWENYPRTNCHVAFQAAVDKGGFGQLYHFREVTPVEDQLDIEPNRDTIYSLGVSDLTEPVTITLPDSGERYQSMNVQNEDQYVKLSVTEPGSYTITQDLVGDSVCWRPDPHVCRPN